MRAPTDLAVRQRSFRCRSDWATPWRFSLYATPRRGGQPPQKLNWCYRPKVRIPPAAAYGSSPSSP